MLRKMPIRLLPLPPMWQKPLCSLLSLMKKERTIFVRRAQLGRFRMTAVTALSLPAPSCAITVSLLISASIPAIPSSLLGTIPTFGPFGRLMKSPTLPKSCKVSWISISPMALMNQSSPMVTTPVSTIRRHTIMPLRCTKMLSRLLTMPLVLPRKAYRNGLANLPLPRLRSL